MGRSSGYRARLENKAEIDALRARLSNCRASQWQRAGMIMRQITEALGHRGGPMGAIIEPRACRYCNYYGHTRQHCEVRKRDEKERIDSELKADRKFLSSYQKQCDPEWSAWLKWQSDKREYAVQKCGSVCMEECSQCDTCLCMQVYMQEYTVANPEPQCRYAGQLV